MPNPLRLVDTGLTFDVNTNWTSILTSTENGNGYHIYIDELPDIFRIPVFVPAQMDVLLNLDEPRRDEQKTDCVPNEKIPKLKYYDDYDSQGIQCEAEAIIDLSWNLLGCTFPFGSYFPLNGSCLFEAWAIITLIIGEGAQAFDNKPPTASSNAQKINSTTNKPGETMSTIENEAYDNSKTVFAKDSSCKPLCSRWTYPVFSASYASIKYRDEDLENRHWANRSLSRVRVILPQSSSRHKEEPRVSAYLALCEIGGMMGIYAGFSMITYVQILAYGVYIFWYLIRKKLKTGTKIQKAIKLNEIAVATVETTFLERLQMDNVSKIRMASNATSNPSILANSPANLNVLGVLIEQLATLPAPDRTRHAVEVLETEL